MTKGARLRFVSTILVCFGAVLSAQERIENWPAPGLWSPPARAVAKGELAPMEADAIEAVPTPPLHFVGITPCRLVDTRGNGFTGAYGPPVLAQGVQRNFVLAGQCGISASAQAVSLNVTVTNTQGPGFILIYPTGGAQPTVSTLNYVAGQTVANAAVVPLGTGGAITVIAGVSGTDLILDTNGDYVAGVVTTLNGLSGNVNLAAGSNVTITPSGQTLTVASSGGLPSGTANQTLRHDGSNWVPSSALTNDGTNVAVSGILTLPASPEVRASVSRFIHGNQSNGNTFLGLYAGNAASPGDQNTGVGYSALFATTVASVRNVAVGIQSLVGNTTGDDNVAMGAQALYTVNTGNGNIGIGTNALHNVNSGSGNIALGTNIGNILSTGSNNIYIGAPNAGDESGQIRIGNNAVHTQGTVIASISGFGATGGDPVYVTTGGRLGTVTSSSRRYKEEIRDLATESDGVLRLRPVAFRYKEEFDPSRRTQYGLIAEEVAEVYPELIIYGADGRPEGVRYHLLAPLLLDELQKQRRSIEAQHGEIESLKAQLAKLAARLEGRPEP